LPRVAAPDPIAILNTLAALCAERVPLALMSRDLLVICHGHFAEVGQDALTLEFEQQPAGLDFSPPAFCVGSFNQSMRPHMFTTRIKRNAQVVDGGLTRIDVEVPATMRWPESRVALRFPVPPTAPLRVRVRSGQYEIEATAKDVSLCGALIALQGEQVGQLAAGERIEIGMELSGRTVVLRAIVRRRAHPHYGVYFPDAVTESHLNPPGAWRDMLDAVGRYGQQ